MRNVLTRAVKHELNCLFTEPPQWLEGGVDFGLFCREHAYVVYLLCRANGLPADIVLGHYFAVTPGGECNYTHDSGADHAWCAVGATVPVDLSMTFRCAVWLPGWARVPDLVGPVLGPGTYGAYRVTYTRDEAEYRSLFASWSLGHVAYLEVGRVEAAPLNLADDPFRFLLAPASGVPRLTDELGADLYAKIVLHVDEIAHGHARRLAGTMPQARALQAVAAGYPEALPWLRSRLGA